MKKTVKDFVFLKVSWFSFCAQLLDQRSNANLPSPNVSILFVCYPEYTVPSDPRPSQRTNIRKQCSHDTQSPSEDG